MPDQSANGGNDGNDSDANPVTGVMQSVTLVAGETNPTLDAGLYAPVTVGDYVWYDTNGDGQQGVALTEPGVPGVVVALYNTATGQPVLLGGQPLTATTDAAGLYLFSGLPPGDYFVTFNLATLPATYGVTGQNTGDDATDSDANPTTGQTDSTGFLGSGEKDLTLDLGIVAPDLVLKKQASVATAGPGAVVTYTLTYTNSGFGAT